MTKVSELKTKTTCGAWEIYGSSPENSHEKPRMVNIRPWPAELDLGTFGGR